MQADTDAARILEFFRPEKNRWPKLSDVKPKLKLKFENISISFALFGSVSFSGLRIYLVFIKSNGLRGLEEM